MVPGLAQPALTFPYTVNRDVTHFGTKQSGLALLRDMPDITDIKYQICGKIIHAMQNY